MRFFLLFSTVFVFFGISFFHLEPRYDFSIERIPLSHLSYTHSGGYTLESRSSKNIVYLGIKSSYEFSDAHSLCLTIDTTSGRREECLDTDGEKLSDEIFTFPLSLQTQEKKISFRIHSEIPLHQNDIMVYSMNTASQGSKPSFRFPKLQADTNIISRADWGADETMRYVDSPYWKDKYPAYLNYLKRPKTQVELDAINLDIARTNYLEKNFGDTAKTTSIRRTENGHELLWPIQKVKKVDKIILHHTAESLDKEASDEELIRAIYAYHTLSRQWGDIGYNFLVGQRGKIYEGRAGGDYVVGAHASYNNMGSVGIATLGNFQTLSLNRDQQRGLENAITLMAKKYGITLSSITQGVRMCNTATCSPLELLKIPSLIGHRDVGTTSCPGDNLYSNLPDWRERLSTYYAPILNTEKLSIETIPAYRVLNMTPIGGSINVPNSPPTVVKSVPITRYIGQKFRVKLSYPDLESIVLSPYSGTGYFFIDKKKYILTPGKKLNVGIVGNNQLEVTAGENTYNGGVVKFSANVARIDSWSRIPAWDKKGTYNDNLFRDTISIRNVGGKILVISELPLEWYLKGIGEVSNGDPAEKIKTIIVAARSYARYYMDPKNRKYDTSIYDGSDDPDSFQKYLGYSYEMRSPNTVKAVDVTRNQIISYSGKLIKPWYFSSSDGRTRSYKEYCESNNAIMCEDIPYLQSVDDPAGVGKDRAGHGVGISGVGATYLANLGKSYTEIIQYYLKGVEIQRK